MKAFPLLGLLLDLAIPRHARPGILAEAILSILTVVTFVQAVTGKPFL